VDKDLQHIPFELSLRRFWAVFLFGWEEEAEKMPSLRDSIFPSEDYLFMCDEAFSEVKWPKSTFATIRRRLISGVVVGLVISESGYVFRCLSTGLLRTFKGKDICVKTMMRHVSGFGSF
jgi:hypothetical protein